MRVDLNIARRGIDCHPSVSGLAPFLTFEAESSLDRSKKKGEKEKKKQLGQVRFVFSNADILCRPVYRARLDMLALFLSIGILDLTPTLTHPFYLS